MELEETNPFLQGVKDCIPTLIGYISIGLAAGIVAAASHLSVLEMALMSILVYAGASQFIICALLVAGSPISVIILTVFIVNLRHLLLSMALAPQFTKYSVLKNVGFATLLTDESFGVAANKVAQGEKLNDHWMNGLNITAYLSWIVSCVIGTLFGKWISNPEVFGLDFALTAMFIALLVLQLQSVKKTKLYFYLSLVLYMIIAMVIFCMFVPSHVAVILSTILVATIGVVTDR
ncbi:MULTISPECIES: AzlC family ABC transporter permease [Bacillus]|uniref:AzlC family ABC transporter permease n=1 Tax=Bacillus TaxID=1386 RepID=UPI00054ED99D|nr:MULTISPECIES: AzlC family ABC transporter permease [Bacillus]